MMADAIGPQRVQTLRLTNSSANDWRLVLEPWGEEYSFPRGAHLDVIAEGPESGSLEFDFADDRITIFGWSGSVVSLFVNGVELGSAHGRRPTVPPTPRSF
jgi:hypothetical protein